MDTMPQISTWRVKLQTPLDSELRKDEDTGDDYLVYRHTPYEFTVAEALQLMCRGKISFDKFEDMMIYNVNLRDAMCSFGVRAVVKHIREFAPNNKELHRCLDSFMGRHPDGSIGDLDIQVYSTKEDVEILGHVFHGLEDIMAYNEISLCERYMSKERPIRRSPKKRGDVHVGKLWESYPCFDSSDYAYETRTYQNYLIRNRPITDADMQKIKNLPAIGNFEKINEQMPLDVLPMVYYSGDGGFMLVATRRK